MGTDNQKARDWGTVALGARIGESADPRWVNCWGHMLTGGLRAGDTLLDAGIELPHHFTAAVVLQFFVKSDADTLLMVDSDMIFKPDTLERLRSDSEGWGYDVLGAFYVTRRRPFAPVIQSRRPDPQPGQSEYECIEKDLTGRIVEADAIGAGFTLIRRSVLKRIDAELGIDRWCFEFGFGGVGEDIMFCQRAKTVGARIGVHTGVPIGHRGKITFCWDAEENRSRMEASDQVSVLLET